MGTLVSWRFVEMENKEPKKKTKKWKIFLLIGIVLVLIVGSLFLSSSSVIELINRQNSYNDNGIGFKLYSTIDNSYIKTPKLNSFNVTLDGGLKISYRNYAITYQPLFVMEGGQIFTWSQIPTTIGKKLWKIKVSPSEYKYGADFWNVSDNIKNNLKFVVLNRTNATKQVWNNITNVTDIVPMTLADVQGKIKIQGGSIILNDEVTISHDDVLRTYNIPVINRSMIVIGNLNNSWSVCDSWDVNGTCLTSHTEANWIDNGDGTWNITFDPTITLSGGDVVSTSILTNVTAETGDANFTHLNISTTAPYNSLVGYWSFDGDKEDTLLTTHYDFSDEGNDGTGVNQVNTTSTGCLTDFGNCAQFDGVGDFITIGNPTSLQIAGNITIAGWFNTRDNTTFQVLISRHTGTQTWFIRTDGDNFQFDIDTGGTSPQVNSITTIAENTWYHVAGTYNGTGMNLYINGVLDNSGGATGTIVTGSNIVRIGSRNGGMYMNGSIDEVMVFNTSLTAQQILDIYNNQSARFLPTGTQDINNQSFMNISTGNNRVNVSTFIQNNFNSIINLTVGYYDGSWSATAPQTVVSNTNMTFTISSTSTNLTLNYTFIAGNSTTNPFYSPIIFDDISIETFSSAVADTCTYTSGNWAIDCSDNCNITSNVDVGGNNISIIGTGLFTTTANITNYLKLLIRGTDTSNICRVRCSSGGCFKD